MKYEDIYNEKGGFNRGNLRKFLLFLLDKCDNMLHTLDEGESDLHFDIWSISDCVHTLDHIYDLTVAESIFGYGLSEISDPQSKFVADKTLREFGRDVMCNSIRQIKDEIRELEFEDYRAKNLHMEIYRSMQYLYEDYCKEYDVKK